MGRREELLHEEERAWQALQDLLARLGPERVEEPGVTDEGWSPKDVLWHLGCWAAESARELARIRMGTYVDREYDTDAVNREFFEAGRELGLSTVKTELTSARQMARQAWAALPEPTPDAEYWFQEAGPIHYGDHLKDLRAFLERGRP